MQVKLCVIFGTFWNQVAPHFKDFSCSTSKNIFQNIIGLFFFLFNIRSLSPIKYKIKELNSDIKCNIKADTAYMSFLSLGF